MELFEDVAKPLVEDLIHCKNGKWVKGFSSHELWCDDVQNFINGPFIDSGAERISY